MKQRVLLRVARAAHEPRVSQRELARKAGVGSSFRMWQIENGEGLPPTKREKTAVATALKLLVDDIEWPDVEQRAATA